MRNEHRDSHMIGIIGGSGLYDIDGVNLREVRQIKTPFGMPSDAYRIGIIQEGASFSFRDMALYTAFLHIKSIIRLTYGF